MKKITKVNDVGIKITDPECMIQEIKLYPEDGRVQVWATVGVGEETKTGLQYLSPTEAMTIAKALEKSAIEALRQAVKI